MAHGVEGRVLARVDDLHAELPQHLGELIQSDAHAREDRRRGHLRGVGLERQERLLREYAETTEKDEGLLPEVESFWKKIRSVIGVKDTDDKSARKAAQQSR